MDFLSLFIVASMPVLQVLLIGLLGAFLATGQLNILSPDARRHINKIVYIVFTPALVFSSLAQTVTLEDIISWWFMPVNIGITFLVGGVFGWIAVKILKPPSRLEGLIIANCSAGNLGNILLIIVPAICNQSNSPFGDQSICNAQGLSYVSFSMALGSLFIWTIAYNQVKKSATLYGVPQSFASSASMLTSRQGSFLANLLPTNSEKSFSDQGAPLLLPNPSQTEDADGQLIIPLTPHTEEETRDSCFMFKEILHQLVEEFMSPAFVAAVLGFLVGAVSWLRNILTVSSAPLKVIQDSIVLLGQGTVPCITLILGGNLTQGLRKSGVKPLMILAIICVRYVIQPLCGIGVVKLAGELGFLPASPLYRFVLLIQYTLPPAMAIGTMVQLFDVGNEECSVIFMWTYLVASIALTLWSTVFMWIVL